MTNATRKSSQVSVLKKEVFIDGKSEGVQVVVSNGFAYPPIPLSVEDAKYVRDRLVEILDAL